MRLQQRHEDVYEKRGPPTHPSQGSLFRNPTGVVVLLQGHVGAYEGQRSAFADEAGASLAKVIVQVLPSKNRGWGTTTIESE